MKPIDIPNSAKIVTVAQMQQIEQAADAQGHRYATMMEIAGRAVAHAVEALYPGCVNPVLILVGPGNNGGDGLVCAHQLHASGIACRLYLWRRSTDPADDYEDHLGKVVSLGIETVHTDTDEALTILNEWLAETEIVVDALLGTGNQRPITDRLAQILSAIHARQAERTVQVVAVDCPSGLTCDRGEVDPLTVQADLTVTFGYSKWGHHIFPGVTACGEVKVVNIGMPPTLADSVQTFLIEPSWVANQLPRRSVNSHKGTFGKVMAVVGCMNYPGAAYLSCAAADRVGAGLITGAIPRSIWPVVAGKLAEPTWLPLSETASGHIRADGAADLLASLNGYSALLLGCGLGQTEETQAFIQTLLTGKNLPPTVLDADGLNGLAQLADWPDRLPKQAILTPHPAEMARLCGMTLEEVRANRWALARAKAAEWQTVILLKGPYTVIAEPRGTLAVLPIATPALATAGTGDVLAGTITGLLAQGVGPFEAACAGAWIHGQAGQLCEGEIGAAGVIASDLLPRIPRCLVATMQQGQT